MPHHHWRRLAASVSMPLLVASCMHYQTEIPGVLDLRSDGSAAASAPVKNMPSGDVNRSGFNSIFSGDGLKTRDGKVTVEERHYWIIGLIPIFNTSARDELDAALGNAVLRDVTLSYEEDIVDVATMLVPVLVNSIPFVGQALSIATGVFLPPMTFGLEARRVQGEAGTSSWPAVTAPLAGDAAPLPLPPVPPVPPAPTGGVQ